MGTRKKERFAIAYLQLGRFQRQGQDLAEEKRCFVSSWKNGDQYLKEKKVQVLFIGEKETNSGGEKGPLVENSASPIRGSPGGRCLSLSGRGT